MKLQQNKTGSFIIVLPKQLVNAKQWQVGDILKAEIDSKGNIVLRK